MSKTGFVIEILNSSDQINNLKGQCLASLSNSTKKIQEVLSANKEQNVMIDKIWEAYSQAELGIGLAKLAFRDKLEIRIGRFRELYAAEIPGRKTVQIPQRIELGLSVSKNCLESAISNLNEGKAAEGLEQARKGRDILKLLLLENSSSTSRKKSRSRTIETL